MRGKKFNNKKKQNPNRINNEIKSYKVRLVGDNIKEPGVYFFDKALQMAEVLGLDLVEVSVSQEMSICKIMDYSKFLFDKQKSVKKTVKIDTKEIRFRPTTDVNDFNFKKNHAQKFLEKRHRVKAYVMFKGREMNFKEQGEEILLKLAVELEEYGVAENVPKMEGYRMTIFLKPKKGKK